MTDNRVPVFPIKDYNKGAAGAASIEISDDGVLKFVMRVTATAGVGTVRYLAAVVVTGFYNDEPGHILLTIPHHTLTVGRDPFKTREKRETWLHRIDPGDVRNVRRVHLILDRDKSEGDFVSHLIKGIQRVGDLWDSADSLYKKIKDSELGKAIATTAA